MTPIEKRNPIRLARCGAMLGLLLVVAAECPGQSGAAGNRLSGRAYGVNLTHAVYQYDDVRSPEIDDEIRLAQSFSSAEDGLAYLVEKYKLDSALVRHARAVGLSEGETFHDAAALGPDYLFIDVTAEQVTRGSVRFTVLVKYGEDVVLEARAVQAVSFESVLLRGERGMFGVKYFVGPGGRQESAPIERRLLLSVTPEIVPVSSLRNRPEDISSPVEETGSPIELNEGDRFILPVPLERVTPTFDSGRPIEQSVVLACVVTAEGKVTNVRVVKSIDPVIDERAVAALRQWRFAPARLNGRPVYATYREELRFYRRPTPAEIQAERERELEKEKEKKKPWRPDQLNN